MCLRYLLLILLTPTIAFSQEIITQQSFEGEGWEYTANTLPSSIEGGFIGKPSVYQEHCRIAAGQYSLQVSNQMVKVSLEAFSLEGSQYHVFSFALAAISQTVLNGVDAGDHVRVWVVGDEKDLSGHPTLTIQAPDSRSNINYGIVQGAEKTFSTVAGQQVILNDIAPVSRYSFDIPSDWNTLWVRFELQTDQDNEIWCLDDIQLMGEPKGCVRNVPAPNLLQAYALDHNRIAYSVASADTTKQMLLVLSEALWDGEVPCWKALEASDRWKEGSAIGNGHVVAIGGEALLQDTIYGLQAGETYLLTSYTYQENQVLSQSSSSLYVTLDCGVASSQELQIIEQTDSSLQVDWSDSSCASYYMLLGTKGLPLEFHPERLVYTSNTMYGRGEMIGNAHVLYWQETTVRRDEGVRIEGLSKEEDYLFYLLVFQRGEWKVVDTYFFGKKVEKQLLENFEGNFKNSYTQGGETFGSGPWYFEEAGVFTANRYDTFHGKRSIRMRASGKAEMQFDLEGEVGRLCIQHAAYYRDPTAFWVLEVSTDQGQHWEVLGDTVQSMAAQFQTAIFEVNQRGPIRFRVRMTHGVRLNLDDIYVDDVIRNGHLSVYSPQVVMPLTEKDTLVQTYTVSPRNTEFILQLHNYGQVPLEITQLKVIGADSIITVHKGEKVLESSGWEEMTIGVNISKQGIYQAKIMYCGRDSTLLNETNLSIQVLEKPQIVALPLQWLSVEGKVKDGCDELYFELADTKEGVLELQISADGYDFETVGNPQKMKEGKRDYYYSNCKRMRRVNYYRAVALQDNGTLRYSPVVRVVGGEWSVEDWSIYPNPVKEQVYLRIPEGKEYYMEVSDLLGRQLLSRYGSKRELERAIMQYRLTWPTGTVMLKLSDGRRQRYFKVMIEGE
ncbi:T9SS type A sorting domain-containing protein [Algivirga pacifica]|uniref:Por secretion system C-terminal sorting domain-containing protein n=1 Tax=Algivirga pacifica TaxID=1162670 RepID=A0ABP9DJP0_9BACT